MRRFVEKADRWRICSCTMVSKTYATKVAAGGWETAGAGTEGGALVSGAYNSDIYVRCISLWRKTF